ncbi:type II toxin-antitoxin system RelE/ParE family toxin [Xenorhabdus bovienii]|uniref:type II toxin-antitoxin system RelE/ParE family toxin n=1 Tax=Xenorhabdus bovienii TaxID=40576 RepID=UPI00237CF5ED|nr:type II toxin-antitoxin system RelE/ParE family toxin [Xenorhabdus bovienii]MDE1489027.1 type II toxin-antitoxin system RelE/ParE family toxin [Xenorhabdus bovienii]MDE1497175.1 type II toxin-antitoxin system RelE/ParE family toxin [Xenorhabdus bovienii]MDE9472910.1 type II toxin-antitoxin system RelE/ParE family toxin [Xenorhabdus bovienii]MDE9479907.1 type II toxin-antitoxin system RelE/ParE family toxin [Xenorhabdus bovienii]MDE9532928.1 type II toxin-antitoxin system RelE/ParE family to
MWEIITTELFDQWFEGQPDELQESVLAAMNVLELEGPMLGRPLVDTLNGSQYPNMKELRIQHHGEPIRAFFAFDPNRNAIILCAGNKAGQNQKLFYKEMINIADEQFKIHLENLER